MRFLLLLLLLAPQEDLVKRVVPDAEKVKKTAKKLAPAAKEKVEKALGEKLEAADLAAPIWEAYASLPQVSSSEKTLIRILAVSVKGPQGPIKVGVAVAVPEATLHRVVVLESGGEKAVEARAFLSQFEGFEYGPDLYAGPEVLAAALKKAAPGSELAVLTRTIAMMRTSGPVYERMHEKLGKKDKTAVEDAAALDRMLDASLKLLPGAGFLQATQQEKFRGFAALGRTLLRDIQSLAGAGKFDEAYKKAGELDGQSCARCHGAYRRSFRAAREKNQVGNGHFSVQLDLAAPDPAAEASFAAAAKAVRKAVLIAAEAR